MRALRGTDRGPVAMTESYETFAHEADIGIRGFGDTQEEAFANTALALYSVMVDVTRVEPKESRVLTVSAEDDETLLVEWLNALLALSDIERMVFSRFAVTIAGRTLTGTAWGERLDRERHAPNVEVKGATYHLLRAGKEGERYLAQCVVDV